MRKGKIHVRSTDKHVLATRPAKLTLAVSSPTRAGSSTRIVVKGCVLPVDDFRSSSARSFGSTFSIPSNKIWPEDFVLFDDEFRDFIGRNQFLEFMKATLQLARTELP